jgi:hypothetical protein
MANKHRAEVEFEGKKYALRMKQMAELEDTLNIGIPAFLASMQENLTIKNMVLIMSISSQDGLSLDDAYDMADELGFEKMATLIQKIFEVAFISDQEGTEVVKK